jgi:hypothetical protein
VDSVDWFDEDGAEVRLTFEDGSVRNGAGTQAVVWPEQDSRQVSNGNLPAAPAVPASPPLVWGPPRWDERVDEAWDTYIAGDEAAALAAIGGIDRVEFVGDYDVWTFVESGLALSALILDGLGEVERSAALRARLDVEARSKNPALARTVLLRGLREELPVESYSRLRETARRWARAEVAELDRAEVLCAHAAALSKLRAEAVIDQGSH